jgi:hypothetical protein
MAGHRVLGPSPSVRNIVVLWKTALADGEYRGVEVKNIPSLTASIAVARTGVTQQISASTSIKEKPATVTGTKRVHLNRAAKPRHRRLMRHRPKADGRSQMSTPRPDEFRKASKTAAFRCEVRHQEYDHVARAVASLAENPNTLSKLLYLPVLVEPFQ